MENETIEEAVGFIETATENIKKALEADRPRDGITLRELIQLMKKGQRVTVRTMKGLVYWKAQFRVNTETIMRDGADGLKLKKSAVPDGLESFMAAKVTCVVPSSDEWIVEVEGGL